MPRYNLIEARELADLSQEELAEAIGAERRAVIAWERGDVTPQPGHRRRIREKLQSQDRQLFTNYPEVQTPLDDVDTSQSSHSDNEEPALSSPCQRESPHDTMDSSNSIAIPGSEQELVSMDKGRRNLNSTIAAGIIAAGTGVALVSSTQIITAPLVEADAYLDVCRTSIGTWWHWYNTGNYLELESALNKNVPVLKNIAKTVLPLQRTVSPLQKEAASLAVEAMIMQIALSTRNLKYSQRERHCYDAIQMGELSGDRNLLARAQYWYGDTFTYCYNEPQTAIELLNGALKNVSDVDGNPLIATRISSNLSIAHAQNHDETNALDCIELAYSTMPSQPALDNRLDKVGHAELDQFVGKAYLYLADRIPNRSYASQARDLFEKSISQTTVYLVQAIVRLADAYRAIGDKDECVTCLTNAYEKSPNIQRLSQINDVLHRVPENWQKETPIQNLQKDITHALVVARR
jgi:transcriptional regulator with XRE-family HTH domain